MEFITNLFWFPLNFAYVAINIGLWALIGWGVYEAIRQLREK